VRILLGFAGLLLALGALYWVVSHSDARHHAPSRPESTPQ
jgi:hypothetical protein